MGSPPSASESLEEKLRRAEEPRDSLANQQALARARAVLLGRATPVVLSRYVLLERIGAGGRGVVHRAYDPTLERRVAIKLVRTDLDDEPGGTSRARLLREAQAIAQLSHPNVVAVFDVGMYDSAQLMPAPTGISGVEGHEGVFVVMEYVEGPTLAQWLATPRPWRAVVDVCLAAGRGLAAAHAAGLIHRDFKPANVLLGNDGRVRVLDFGLARVTDAFSARSPLTPPSDGEAPASAALARGAEADDDDDDSTSQLASPLTRVGAVLGTPVYMAPEQHRRTDLDARADQYAFCVVLFEALYGRRPFGADGGKALLAEKQRGAPTPRSAAVPEHLARIVARGLAPAPDDRFPAMEALLEALARDPTRTRRRVVIASTSAVLVAALGLVVAVDRAREEARCDALRSTSGAWDEPIQAAGRRAFADTGLAYAPDTWTYVAGELDAYATAWAEAKTTACRQRAEATPCLDARRSALQAVTDRFASADIALVETATEVVQLLPPIDACKGPSDRDPGGSSLEPSTDLLRAESSRLVGRLDEARGIAEAVREQASAEGDLALRARALLVLARVASPSGPDLAGLYQAWSAAERAGDARTAIFAASEVMTELGLHEFRFDDAAGLGEVVGAMLERAPRDPLLEAEFTQRLAEVRFAAGEVERALADSERVLALLEEHVGANHPKLVGPLELIGRTIVALGRADEARAVFERAHRIVVDALGPHHPAAIPLLDGLSKVDQLDGDLDGARARGSECLAIAERAHGGVHPRVAVCARRLAAVEQARDRPERAIEWLERALAIERATHGNEHPDTSETLRRLASTLEQAGRLAEATAAADEAVRIDRVSLPPTHPKLAVDLMQLARVRAHGGDGPGAKTAYEEVVRIALGLGEREAFLRRMAIDAHVGIAQVLLDAGEGPAALDAAGRALAASADAPRNDPRRFAAKFVAARALWPAHPRWALRLATSARDGYANSGASSAVLARIDAWLAGKTVEPP